MSWADAMLAAMNAAAIARINFFIVLKIMFNYIPYNRNNHKCNKNLCQLHIIGYFCLNGRCQ